MSVDLSKLSYKELLKLQASAAQATKDRRADALKALRAHIRKLIADEGFTLDEVFPAAAKAPAADPATSDKVAPGVPKYFQAGKSWTGKGRKPAWVAEHLAAGGTLEELLKP